MKLTPKIIAILNNNIFSGIESISTNVGSLIYSTSISSSQIVLIESGDFRLIDNNKTFGSYTLFKENVPSIFSTVAADPISDGPVVNDILEAEPIVVTPTTSNF